MAKDLMASSRAREAGSKLALRKRSAGRALAGRRIFVFPPLLQSLYFFFG